MFALPARAQICETKKLDIRGNERGKYAPYARYRLLGFCHGQNADSRFLTQSDRFSFNELVQASSLPSFITDLSEKYRVTPPGRIYVPISDTEATVSYYLVCKKEKAKEFDELFRLL